MQNREKPSVQFATFKFHKKCVYSHTHYLYTRDESLLPDMPPPHPPYTRKSEIFDARQYRRVDKKALKVHTDLSAIQNHNDMYHSETFYTDFYGIKVNLKSDLPSGHSTAFTLYKNVLLAIFTIHICVIIPKHRKSFKHLSKFE